MWANKDATEDAIGGHRAGVEPEAGGKHWPKEMAQRVAKVKDRWDAAWGLI